MCPAVAVRERGLVLLEHVSGQAGRPALFALEAITVVLLVSMQGGEEAHRHRQVQTRQYLQPLRFDVDLRANIVARRATIGTRACRAARMPGQVTTSITTATV